MALQRTFTRHGFSADYLHFFRFDELDHDNRRCVAIFSLWKDAATYATEPRSPWVPRAVRLILTGDKFDQYVSKDALAGPPTKDITAQVYLAAKSEPVDYWGGQLPNLADAVDV